MASLYQVASGGEIHSDDLNQIVRALTGALGVPIKLDAMNDISNWALLVRNAEGSQGKAVLIQGPTGNTIFQADKFGIKASPDGSTAAGAVRLASQKVTNADMDDNSINGAKLVSLDGGKLNGGSVNQSKLAGDIQNSQLNLNALPWTSDFLRNRKIQMGFNTIHFATSTQSQIKQINFDTAFSTVPNIVVTSAAAALGTTESMPVFNLSDYTTSQFKIWGATVNAAQLTTDWPFFWIAIG